MVFINAFITVVPHARIGTILLLEHRSVIFCLIPSCVEVFPYAGVF